MKFFEKLRKAGSSSNILASQPLKDGEESTLNLDYFREYGTLSKLIVDRQKQLYKKYNKGDQQRPSWDISDLDDKLNDEFVNERALKKYGVAREDFMVTNCDWFPRLRVGAKHDGNEENGYQESDAESVNSDDSDFDHDGFAGPFSWETRSLQEMEFPPTPIGERKLSPAPGKSHFSTKQLPKRMASQDLDDSHRSYETIEQLRARLKQNYLEAKRQREKYLNLSPTRKKDGAKSLNGYRSKTQQQPVFKNYKQKSEVQERTNGVVKFDNQLSVNGVRTTSPDDQFTSELSQALSNKKTTNDREIIPTVYLGDQSNLKSRDSTSNLNGFSKQESFDQHRSPPPKTSEKPQGYKTNNASKSTVKSPKHMHQMSRDNSIDLDRPSNQNPGSTNLTRKNSLKNLVKRSDSRSSIKKDTKRSPEINHNDIDNVLTNHNINDDISKKKIHHEEAKGEEEGNEFDVMDMLANW